VLREHVEDESVDLVYLDPPFNSQRDYNVIHRDDGAEESPALVRAFVDSWQWSPEAHAAYRRLVSTGASERGVSAKLTGLVESLHTFLGPSNLLAYVAMMAERLVALHRALKPTGSLYLHCDPTASHYLRLLLDAIFGQDRFRNEIVWKRSSAHSDGKQGSRHFGRVSDSILLYAKSEASTWNTQYVPYDARYIAENYKRRDPDGRLYRISDAQGPGGAAKGNPRYEFLGVTRHWRYSRERMQELHEQGRIVQTRPGAVPQYKRYLDEMPGVPLQSLWTDIPVINNRSKEHLGYPTQKPVALLERILATSSSPGDVVLDPFCGCGTTLEAAQKLGRQWIGIDIARVAIDIIEQRLTKIGAVRGVELVVTGEPHDVSGQEAIPHPGIARAGLRAMPTAPKRTTVRR
jgi:site-specific DNA-methyltransferase (adenine-specific)